jgi:hypothetical protein
MKKILFIILLFPLFVTAQGELLTTTQTIDGYTARFDGIDDFTYVPNFTILNQDTFTLEFNIYMYDVGTSQQWVWSYYQDVSNLCVLQYNNSYVQCYIGSLSNRARLTAVSISDNWVNQWRNVRVEYTGKGTGNAGRIAIYVNGNTAALNFAGTIPDTVAFNGSQYFGSYGGVLFGFIRYSECKISADCTLIAQYTFCEGYEDTIYDVSGNDYHMSVNNTNPDFFWFWHREDSMFCEYLVTNGFELYSDGADFVRVPYRLDGSKITPTITGFSKIANRDPAYFDPKPIRINGKLLIL